MRKKREKSEKSPFAGQASGLRGESLGVEVCALSALCALRRWIESVDRRDDAFVYAVRSGERPICHPRRCLPVSVCGVVLSRLSNLLNQENALSAPCSAVVPAFRRSRRGA